jgi:hypothetical protein
MDNANTAGCEPVFRGKNYRSAIPYTIPFVSNEAILCPYPQMAIRVTMDGTYSVMRQSVSCGEGDKPLIIVSGNTT